MITMPLETIVDLLEKGANVEFLVVDAEGEAADDESGEAERDITEDPFYGELLQAVEELSPDELDQLLTLARYGAEESEPVTWDDAAATVRAMPEEDRAAALMQELVLGTAISSALSRLGYALDDEDEDDADDEEDAEESD